MRARVHAYTTGLAGATALLVGGCHRARRLPRSRGCGRRVQPGHQLLLHDARQPWHHHPRLLEPGATAGRQRRVRRSPATRGRYVLQQLLVQQLKLLLLLLHRQ